jgi:AGCS family alanine or glycine:cation symporter
MCLLYCIGCGVLIGAHIDGVPATLGAIVHQAFSGPALFGGFLGVLTMGLRRGAFSSEGGLGTAAIAHAAGRIGEPVREGVVAMIGPAIDTLLVCTLTALAILLTGVHAEADPGTQIEGAVLTADAFRQFHPAFATILVVAVALFAYSTTITWSYYGAQAVELTVGRKTVLPYRVVFVAFVALAPHLSMDHIVGFTDLMMLSAALPNLVGMALLAGPMAPRVRDYLRRLRAGEL